MSQLSLFSLRVSRNVLPRSFCFVRFGSRIQIGLKTEITSFSTLRFIILSFLSYSCVPFCSVPFNSVTVRLKLPRSFLTCHSFVVSALFRRVFVRVGSSGVQAELEMRMSSRSGGRESRIDGSAGNADPGCESKGPSVTQPEKFLAGTSGTKKANNALVGPSEQYRLTLETIS